MDTATKADGRTNWIAGWRRSVAGTGLTAAMLLALAACGGGGGAGSTGTETNQGVSTQPEGGAGSSGGDTGSGTTTPVAIDAVVDSQDSFDFTPKSAYADAAQLAQATGGALFAAWDPTNPQTALGTGMKVLFFGMAVGCTGTQDQGPVATGSDALYASALQRTALTAVSAPTSRWVPSADTSACDAGTRASLGPGMVQLNPDDRTGSLGMYTAATPDGGFLRPYSAAGQNGAGANAGITGTFVAFRQAWWVADPIQPWLASAGTGAARIVSTQTIGAASAESSGTAGVNQVKQQISVTFLNTECAKLGSTAQRPCQIQYLMNTAIVRTGVTDWSTQAWFAEGDVSFDPAQGGIPVVDGPIDAAGVAALETNTQLPLWTSRGAPTQHGTFTDQNFDVRIDQTQLTNALRIVVGLKNGVPVAQVSDDAMAAMWGARWNDAAAWVLLNSEVGQEVYNPYADRSAWIGGSFKRLYVGRAAS